MFEAFLLLKKTINKIKKTNTQKHFIIPTIIIHHIHNFDQNIKTVITILHF